MLYKLTIYPLQRSDKYSKRRFGLKISAALLYFVICGALPFLSILFSYKNAWLYIEFYSRLFVFPVFFGWITVLCLHNCYSFMKKIALNGSAEKVFWLTILAIALIALKLELQSDNVAPWEVKPHLIDESKILEHFKNTGNNTIDEKVEFQSYMLEKIGPFYEPLNWSLTRYLYILSFSIQFGVLIYLFCLLFATSWYAHRNDDRSEEYYRVVRLLSAAYFASGLWAIMSIGFIVNKIKVYPGEFHEFGNLMILVLYLIGALLLFVHYIEIYRKYLKEALGFLGASIGLIGIATQKDRLAEWFGPEQSIRNSMVLLMVLTLISVLLFILIPEIEKNIRDSRKNRNR